MQLPLVSGLFAIVGGAAGLFAVAAIAAFHDSSRSVPLELSAGVTALAGLVLGGLLAWSNRSSRPFRTPDMGTLQVGAWVILTGAVAGTVVGELTWSTPRGLWAGGLAGGAASVAFIPACLAALGAAGRAERARRGSIVARVDARSVVATMAVVVAVISMGALPGAALGRTDWAGPWLELFSGGIALASLVAVVLALVFDRRARRTLAGLSQSSAELEQRHDARSTGSAGSDTSTATDLGLGDELFDAVRRGTYRAADRHVPALRGNPARALRTVEETMRARHRSLAGVAGILALHASAVAAESFYYTDERSCASGHADACFAAAAALPAGATEAPARAELLRQACEKKHLDACVVLADMLEGVAGVPPSSSRAEPLHEIACAGGVGPSCHWLALRRLHGEHMTRDATAARDLLWEGCWTSHEPSCRLHDALLYATNRAAPEPPSFYERRRLVAQAQ